MQPGAATMGAGSYNSLRSVLGTALLEHRRVHDQELHDEVAIVSDLNGDGEGRKCTVNGETRAPMAGRKVAAWPVALAVAFFSHIWGEKIDDGRIRTKQMLDLDG